jgi:hypothetical protein
LLQRADLVQLALPQPQARTSTTQAIQHRTQKQTRQNARRRGRLIEPQPAHTALVGVAGSAGAGQIAVRRIATNVGAAGAETRRLFHAVTVAWMVPGLPMPPLQQTAVTVACGKVKLKLGNICTWVASVLV